MPRIGGGGARPPSGRCRPRGPAPPSRWPPRRRGARPAGLAAGQARRVDGGKVGRRREEMRDAALRGRQRRAVGVHQAGREGPRGGHRDRLPEDRPDGQLRAVDGTGGATAGHRAHEVGEHGVPAQRLVDRDRVGVEVEQAAAAGDGRPQVAQVGQGERCSGRPRRRRSSATIAGAVREPEAAAVDAVDDLLDAGHGAHREEVQQGRPANGARRARRRTIRPLGRRPRPADAPRGGPSARVANTSRMVSLNWRSDAEPGGERDLGRPGRSVVSMRRRAAWARWARARARGPAPSSAASCRCSWRSL